MQWSTERILTTHTGSLPRPDALSGLLFARMTKKPHDAGTLARQTAGAVAETACAGYDPERCSRTSSVVWSPPTSAAGGNSGPAGA